MRRCSARAAATAISGRARRSACCCPRRGTSACNRACAGQRDHDPDDRRAVDLGKYVRSTSGGRQVADADDDDEDDAACSSIRASMKPHCATGAEQRHRGTDPGLFLRRRFQRKAKPGGRLKPLRGQKTTTARPTCRVPHRRQRKRRFTTSSRSTTALPTI
jgi:hypothetical protein